MKFFVIIFSLIAVAASASLRPSALNNEQQIIQQLIAAINSPSTDPNTAVALEALLQNLLAASTIQQPELVQPVHPIAVRPALVGDGYVPIGVGPALVEAGYEPIAVGPGLVEVGYEPIAVGPGLVEVGYEPIAVGPGLVEVGYEPIAVGPGIVDVDVANVDNLENDAASGVSGLINIIQNIFQVNIVQTFIYNRSSNSAADAAVEAALPEIPSAVLPEAVGVVTLPEVVGVAVLPEAVGVADPISPVVALPEILN